MKVGIIIQARMGSTRLPNKVLNTLFDGNTTIIKEIIERSSLAEGISQVIVAISNSKVDDKLEEYIKNETNAIVFRGDEENVLSRFQQAAAKYNFDQIIRLTGDNPCIDPLIIEQALGSHITMDADYTYTSNLPIGMNVEVAKVSALNIACEEGNSKEDKEHVTHFIRQHSDRFKLNFLKIATPIDVSELRLTVDTKEDYLLMRLIFDLLKPETNIFGLKEIINLYSKRSYIFEINKEIHQKKVFNTLEEEAVEAISVLNQQDLNMVAEFLKKELFKNA